MSLFRVLYYKVRKMLKMLNIANICKKNIYIIKKCYIMDIDNVF